MKQRKLKLFLVLMLAWLLTIPAQGLGNGEAVVSLPLRQTAGRGAYEPVQYSLKAEASGAPMPEGSEDGVFSFTLRGTAETSLRFRFTETGTWTYSLRVDAGELNVSPQTLTLHVYVDVDELGALFPMVTVETAQGTKTELDFSVWKDEPVIPGPFPLSGGPGTGVTDAVGIFLCLSAFLGLTIGNRPGRNRRKEAARQ